MNNIPSRLDEIEAKIRLLIQENKQLKRQNQRLVETLQTQEEKVKKANIAQTAELNAVKQQLSDALSELENAALGEVKDTKQIKQKIDRYVKKIDTVVAFLNNV